MPKDQKNVWISLKVYDTVHWDCSSEVQRLRSFENKWIIMGHYLDPIVLGPSFS